MKEILQKDAPVLRKTANIIPLEKITSQEVVDLLEDMKEALESQADGVALAAPQIGASVRVFIMSEKALKNTKGRDKKLVFINPEIVRQSKKKIWMEEGCLSVRPFYGDTHRAEKTTVRAYDEMGKIFTYGGSGLISQIFQHETDHLDGTLFIDHAKNLHEISEEEIQETYAP